MTEPPERVRADRLLVDAGLFPSRARAAMEIAAGNVRAGGEVITRPAQRLPRSIALEITGTAVPYVSRAGLKLAAALDHFAIPVTGRRALDIGASTGGFSQVLLQRGAAHVLAVDVGHGQLHRDLAGNPSLTSVEGTDARDLAAAEVGAPVDLIVIDVSFISLKKVLPTVLRFAASGAHLVALVKPQFEVGRAGIGKGGVVRDPALREDIVSALCDWISGFDTWCVLGRLESPIVGGDGNEETLIAALREGNAARP